MSKDQGISPADALASLKPVGEGDDAQVVQEPVAQETTAQRAVSTAKADKRRNNGPIDPNKLDTRTQNTERRVKILLEDNADIPPTGQFFSINGRAYILRPGEEADVPEELLNVLNDAVTSVPIVQDTKIVGFRDRLRFPYRVLERTVQ